MAPVDWPSPRSSSVLVVVLVKVLWSFAFPSSNGFWSNQRYPRGNYLDRVTNKAISNQYSKKATRHGRTTTPKEHQRKNDLALLTDV
jgi:hypothetical protein